VAKRAASSASDSVTLQVAPTRCDVTVAAVPGPEPDEGSLDFRGSRRLNGREDWFWYLVAAASYITASIFHKGLLNWFVGPLWLVGVVVVGPAVWDRLRRVVRR
jgi:hypothetical protein